ncbi:MAG: hypothetical protein R3C14_40570 [Caldilineaceae bacterium]
MFTFTNTHKHGIVISDGNQQFSVPSLAELVTLHTELTEYLSKRQQVAFISSLEAVARAKDDGYTLSISTLNGACAYGTIPHARKHAGRWSMPLPEFEQWYARWKAKQDQHNTD